MTHSKNMYHSHALLLSRFITEEHYIVVADRIYVRRALLRASFADPIGHGFRTLSRNDMDYFVYWSPVTNARTRIVILACKRGKKHLINTETTDD